MRKETDSQKDKQIHRQNDDGQILHYDIKRNSLFTKTTFKITTLNIKDVKINAYIQFFSCVKMKKVTPVTDILSE